MQLHPGRWAAASVTLGALVALAAGSAVLAADVEIPEGGAIQRDRTSVVMFRVHGGCEGAATDRLEVAIPDGVENVEPQAVPGWDVSVETADGTLESGETLEPDAIIERVTWTGGPLPASQFTDFGLRALFPDIEGELLFPAVQACGLTEVAWDGDKDSTNPAPRVIVGPAINVREQVEMSQTLDALTAEVEQLREELQGVDPSHVRDRVSAVEDRLPNIADRIGRLEDRIQALEDATAG